MNENERIEKPVLPPFKNWALQNFPFIEDDFDAITNYQLYSKIVEYIKSVDVYMQGVNTFLIEVENYFNNLDVQDEIDKKLDEMAEDGTLTNLISSYIDPQLNSFRNEINEEINDFKDDVTNDINLFETQIENQIDSLASGEPKGVYETTTALIEDNPQTGVYLVTEDGYVYSFVHNASTVTQLVQYQSTGIAKHSIGGYELDSNIDEQLIDCIKIQPTLTTGTYYGIDDNVAVPTSNANYSSCVVEVLPNELYRLNIRTGSANAYGYIFVDNLTDLNVISSGMRGTGTVIYQDQYVKVPSGANYMICSLNVSSSWGSSSFYKCKIKELNTLKDSTIKNCVYETPTFDTTTGYCYKIVDGKAVLSSSANYNCSQLPVNVGDAYYIEWYEYSNATQLYLVTDDEYNILLSGGYGKAELTTEKEYVVIPTGGTKLLISGNNTRDLASPIVRKKATLINYLDNKKIAILGDSISTKVDKNAVEITITEDDVGNELSAYLTYYDVENELSLGGQTFTSSQIGEEVTFTPLEGDIGKVIGLPANYNNRYIDTYWELLEANNNCSITNVSWSGASLSSHEKNSNSYKTSYGWHEAQIRKLGTRIVGTMNRTSPDLVIIYRGVNDFSHTPYVSTDTTPLENYNYTYPNDDYNSSTNKYDYVSALGIVVKKIRETYPTTKIAICTLGNFKRVNYSHYPTNNGQYSLPQFNDVIRKCANYFGLDLIELDKDGITFENCYTSGYTSDSTHPNSKGHQMIYNQVVKDLQ